MDKWREDLLRKAEERANSAAIEAVRYTAKRLDKFEKALELKKRIIALLREEPSCLFGSDNIYIETKNFLLAHDVAKELGVKLERTAESDGINYVGEKDGIQITVYGIKEAAGCKVIAKKTMKEVITYELICNEKAAQE